MSILWDAATNSSLLEELGYVAVGLTKLGQFERLLKT
jgi:hypothetical protein